MNIEDLKKALAPWMRLDTWHTNHPLDNKRFHKALSRAFSEIGTAIDGESFAEVMSELADEHHPNYDSEYKEGLIHDFSLRAEHIAYYLNDMDEK